MKLTNPQKIAFIFLGLLVAFGIYRFFKRQGEKESLRLEHNNLRAGANIIQPGQNSNQILSIETGRQEFAKDHNIDRVSLSAGLLLDEKQTKFLNKL